MILRKLADAMRRQDWLTVALEIVIVMIGILLGLQVNAWNQARIDRAEEAVFLEALYQDVLALEETSRALIDVRLLELGAIATGSDILFGKTEFRALTELECDAISTSHSPGIVATSLPSWTALRDAGRTRIVRNAELQRALATLTQRRDALDRIMGIAEYQGHNLVAQHPELFNVAPVRAELTDTPDRIYFQTYTLCDTEAFAQNTAALSKLASNMNRFSSVVNRFGIVPWAEQVTEIRVILEAQLGEG